MPFENTMSCPICSQRLKCEDRIQYVEFVGKSSEYTKKICTRVNHYFVMHYDFINSKVDYVKFSLDHTYSRNIEVDYVNNKSKVSYFDSKKNESKVVEIGNALHIDFPDLVELKSKISKYLMLI